jgi:hypothetical protein
VAGLSREEFDVAAKEIQDAWNQAPDSRDAGLRVVVDFGRKYGYKNVIAALQGRVPKQFEREKSVSAWIDERRKEEEEA